MSDTRSEGTLSENPRLKHSWRPVCTFVACMWHSSLEYTGCMAKDRTVSLQKEEAKGIEEKVAEEVAVVKWNKN